MRAIFTDDVAHHAPRFLKPGVGIEPELAHREEEAPGAVFSPSRTSGSARALMVESAYAM
jgi:hypothetical protein